MDECNCFPASSCCDDLPAIRAERDAALLKLNEALNDKQHFEGLFKASQHGLAESIAERDALNHRLDDLRSRLSACLDRLGHCEISLSVYEPAGVSEYWIRYPERITPQMVTAVEKREPKP